MEFDGKLPAPGTMDLYCALLLPSQGFPGGSVIKNLPANAGDTGLIPIWKIPHAVEQLSLCATTTEPVLQGPGTAGLEPMCHDY